MVEEPKGFMSIHHSLLQGTEGYIHPLISCEFSFVVRRDIVEGVEAVFCDRQLCSSRHAELRSLKDALTFTIVCCKALAFIFTSSPEDFLSLLEILTYQKVMKQYAVTNAYLIAYLVYCIFKNSNSEYILAFSTVTVLHIIVDKGAERENKDEKQDVYERTFYLFTVSVL